MVAPLAIKGTYFLQRVSISPDECFQDILKSYSCHQRGINRKPWQECGSFIPFTKKVSTTRVSLSHKVPNLIYYFNIHLLHKLESEYWPSATKLVAVGCDLRPLLRSRADQGW